jgi:hypothetical protein
MNPNETDPPAGIEAFPLIPVAVRVLFELASVTSHELWIEPARSNTRFQLGSAALAPFTSRIAAW